MNAARCLEWCEEYGGDEFPDDLRTALHVRDWIADSAARHLCEQPDATGAQWAAVETARANALRIIAAKLDGS